MIRINLLPVREAAQKKSSRQLLVLFAVILLAEVGVLFFLQSEQEAALADVQTKNKQIQKKIKDLQKKTKAVADLQRQTAELEAQKAVLDSLVEGQAGPVKMLDELSRILTPVEDPKLKVEVEERGWDPDWDPRRLWVDTFVENQRFVKIAGHARNNEDLSEFLKRLGTSRHFIKINLNVSSAVERSDLNNAKMVEFDLTALVIYGPADVKRLASGQFEEAGGKGRRKRRRKR